MMQNVYNVAVISIDVENAGEPLSKYILCVKRYAFSPEQVFRFATRNPYFFSGGGFLVHFFVFLVASLWFVFNECIPPLFCNCFLLGTL